MLSYEGLQDVVTAVVVVVAVAVVVAAAWLSTSVREQPLVATAVVVFHSGAGTVENNTSNSNNSSSNVGETAGEGRGGEEAAATPAEDKESDTPVEEGMEVKEVKEVPHPDTLERTPTETPQGNHSDTGAAGGGVGGVGECDLTGGGDTAPSNPLRPSPMREEGPEMEVRRRLQHFVSMGGSVDSMNSRNAAAEEDRLATPPPPADTKQQEGEEKEKEEEEVKDSDEGREETRPPGSIRIRLKFLDETQRNVFAQLTENVGSFKRQHFSIELDANRHIRLIFNGQLLSQDSSTLAQCGLFDNCVVHCHVSQPQLIPRTGGRSGEAAAQEDEDAYVSRLLAPLLYAVMVLMWYLRYEYGHLFNTMSTIILLFLTALLLISTYLLYITHHVPNTTTTTTTTTHIPVAARTTATITTTSSSSSSTSSSSRSTSS